MKVESSCHTQAWEGCWDGGEEVGNGEMLQQRSKDLFGFLIASLANVGISDQMCASVSAGPLTHQRMESAVIQPLFHLAQSHLFTLTPILPQPPALLCTTPHAPPPPPTQVGHAPALEIPMLGKFHSTKQGWEEEGEMEGRKTSNSSKMLVWTSAVQVKSFLLRPSAQVLSRR